MVKQSQAIPTASASTTSPPLVIKKIEPRHSEEVNDILTKMPSWLIRWGITVVFIAMIGVLTLSWFIKYPDVVRTRVVINTSEVPVSIITRTNGPLSLQVKEKDWVEEGALLAYIKNAAHFDDIQALKNSLQQVPQLANYDEFWQLGELQPYFNTLISSLKKAQNTAQGYQDDQSRKQLIQQQLAEVRQSEQNAIQQVKFAQQEYNFAQKMLKERYQMLLIKDVISRETYEQHAKEVLQLETLIQQKQALVRDIKNRTLVLKKEQQNLKFDRSMESVNSNNNIEDAYSRLKSHLALWEQQYLLTAPIAGEIQYLEFAKNNMFLQTDQEIARVIPTQKGELYGEIFIPSAGFGKVDTGQVVIVELDHYPKKEFGSLEGQLQEIATIRADKGYKSKVKLKNALTTTFRKELNFQYGMEGTAKIITEDIRLFHRFIYQLRLVFQD